MARWAPAVANGSSGVGAGGSGGVDGSAGSSGSGGSAGSGGSGGVDSSAGSGGTNGNAGSSGSAGIDGSAGSGGVGGALGSAGSSGSSGAGTGGSAGVDGSADSGGTNGSGGTAGTGGSGGSGGETCSGGPYTAPGYVNLAPPLGVALDPNGSTTLTPPPPTGWKWYPIDGAICRDGSPAGIFVRFTQSDKLFIYLEGGGACTNLGFCNFNPANVNRAISGDGQTVLGSTLGVIDARQQPGVFEGGQLRGIFDTANTANPFRDWNAVYIPYCTGDVFAGTRSNATVPGLPTPQQFVGHANMEKFIGRIVPTFKSKVTHVILTGASAGSVGAGLNLSMVQDAFGCIRVDALLDSGIPFTDTYMPVCLQQRWRNTWGLNAHLPPDCTDCRQTNGGGLLKLADFLIAKHPRSAIAVVSSLNDEVMRLFFSMGLNDCAGYDTADPVGITLGQIVNPAIFYSASQYAAGITEIRTRYVGTGRLATYFLGGANINLHQHVWRARFTDPTTGSATIALFTTRFVNGTYDQIGPP